MGLDGDPLNLLYRRLFARRLQLAGRLEDAEQNCGSSWRWRTMPPALGALGSVCIQQGRLEEALTVTRKANAAMPWSNPVIGQLAALLVRTGAASEADAWIRKLSLATRREPPPDW